MDAFPLEFVNFLIFKKRLLALPIFIAIKFSAGVMKYYKLPIIENSRKK
jgi:hypothetical protein